MKTLLHILCRETIIKTTKKQVYDYRTSHLLQTCTFFSSSLAFRTVESGEVVAYSIVPQNEVVYHIPVFAIASVDQIQVFLLLPALLRLWHWIRLFQQDGVRTAMAE